MSGSFQKKTSNILVTILIGLIVVSFMFTGFESSRGTPDTVAKVGSIPIKVVEYQREYQRQIEFYRNIFGGKDLTTQQIENFGIKKNAIRNLVQRKLTLKLADDLGVAPAPLEVAAEIKKLPYFLTNKQFDITKYKALLKANRLTPKNFEKDMSNQVKGQLMAQLMNEFPVSDGHAKAIEELKKEKIKVHLTQINKDGLRKLIPVPANELKTFLEKEENKERVKSLFKERKASLDQKEEVKARHILIKADEKNQKEAKEKIDKIKKEVTVANFKRLAKKYTEDPSGKNKGGDLGWFSKGLMVPEFDKTAFSMKKGEISDPIKSSFGYHIIYLEDKKEAKDAILENHREKLATEIIRKGKTKELNEMLDDVSSEIKEALLNNKISKAESLAKKYHATIQKDSVVNKFDGAQGVPQITAKDLALLFKTKSAQVFKTASSNIVAVPSSKKLTEKELSFDSTKESQDIKASLSRKLSTAILKSLESEVKVKIYRTIQ